MPCLSEADRAALLRLARAAVREAVTGERLPMDIPGQEAFSEPRGAFVTLRIGGRLRGCIGVMEGTDILGKTVAHCAASAALRDPRFSPLRHDEFSGLQIEISVLSPLMAIRPEEIVIGRHGLVIFAGDNKGLLLPQVAVEHHLDSVQFLEETCRKAGLSLGAWRDPQTRVLGFTCEVFGEEAPRLPVNQA